MYNVKKIFKNYNSKTWIKEGSSNTLTFTMTHVTCLEMSWLVGQQ